MKLLSLTAQIPVASPTHTYGLRLLIISEEKEINTKDYVQFFQKAKVHS